MIECSKQEKRIDTAYFHKIISLKDLYNRYDDLLVILYLIISKYNRINY